MSAVTSASPGNLRGPVDDRLDRCRAFIDYDYPGYDLYRIFVALYKAAQAYLSIDATESAGLLVAMLEADCHAYWGGIYGDIYGLMVDGETVTVQEEITRRLKLIEEGNWPQQRWERE